MVITVFVCNDSAPIENYVIMMVYQNPWIFAGLGTYRFPPPNYWIIWIYSFIAKESSGLCCFAFM